MRHLAIAKRDPGTGYTHTVYSLLYGPYHARGGGFAGAVRGTGAARIRG